MSLSEFLKDPGKLSSFLKQVFGTCAPTPLKSRWHSIEKASSYFLLLHRVGLLFYILSNVDYMAFWPGDNTQLDELGDESYRKKSESRLNRVNAFCRSPEYEKSLMLAFVGSLPRWHLARILDKSSIGGPNPG